MVGKRFYLLAGCVLLTLAVVQIQAQRPILDESGRETGLMNMNPDPYGEPWIAGGLNPPTPEEIAAFEKIPRFTLTPELRNRQLPKTVDHTTEPAFRPIFNQIGGSCGQASGMGYHFSYERNQTLGTTGAEKKNVCAYGFTWNFVNGGSGSGSWPSAGYNIAKVMGCGHVPDFNNADNGGSGTAWMTGYTGYYNANDCHIVSTKSFTTQGIAELKNWFYDKGTGTGKNGGCVTFGASVSYTISTISGGPFSGQKVCTSLPSGSAHAMTLAGYSDEISADLNGDGAITNDVDITRDGTVDYRDRETGAWQLVNSWGTSWNNQGKVWMMYSGFGGGQITGITVQKFTTKLMAKATISHTSRSSLSVKTGFAASVSATTPTATKSYSSAFNKTAGAYPMCGSGASPEIEIGLDISEYAAQINGEAKLFLVLASSGGTGTVKKFSVLDYTGGGTPKEYVCDQADVTIGSSTVLSVVVKQGTTGAVNMQTVIPQAYGLYAYESSIVYDVPYLQNSQNVSLKIISMQGKTIRTLVNGQVEAGSHSVSLNQNSQAGLAAGHYLCRMEAGPFIRTIPVIVK